MQFFGRVTDTPDELGFAIVATAEAEVIKPEPEIEEKS